MGVGSSCAMVSCLGGNGGRMPPLSFELANARGKQRNIHDRNFFLSHNSNQHLQIIELKMMIMRKKFQLLTPSRSSNIKLLIWSINGR